MSQSDPVSVALKQIREVPEGFSLEHIRAELSIAQHAALAVLCQGESHKSAAESAGVHRTTLYRWMTSDPFFKAAFNAWQREVRDSARSRLLKMADDAVNTVGKALADGDRKLAYNLLKDLGLLAAHKDQPIEPGLVRQQMELQCRRQQSKVNVQGLRRLLEQSGLSPRQQRQLLVQFVEADLHRAPESE